MHNIKRRIIPGILLIGVILICSLLGGCQLDPKTNFILGRDTVDYWNHGRYELSRISGHSQWVLAKNPAYGDNVEHQEDGQIDLLERVLAYRAIDEKVYFLAKDSYALLNIDEDTFVVHESLESFSEADQKVFSEEEDFRYKPDNNN